MAYSPSFNPSYPEWHDKPSEDTPVSAAVLANYDAAIEHIEDFLDGSTAVNPDSKVNTMTSPVGVDANGKLWSVPGSSGGGGGASTASEVAYDNVASELTAENVQDAIDELKTLDEIGKTAATTTYDNTSSGLTADDVQEALDELAASSGGNYVDKTGDTMTGDLTISAALTVGSRRQNSAIGTNSLVVGSGSTASGQQSMAHGLDNTASGYASTAEGFNSTATSTYSHAAGNYANATAAMSYARGDHCNASGQYSSAIGYYNTAAQESQTVVGKYNDNKQNTYFEVGNGKRVYSEFLQQYIIEHSNALEVRTDGSVKVGTEIDCDAATTLSDSDYIYITVSGVIKKISLANLKTVLGI